MILHTLNKPPSCTDLSNQLSRVIDHEDSVLLIEDGVYQLLALKQEAISNDHWAKIAKQVYALADDTKARGIGAELESITFISYTQFVELAAKHDKVISWY